MCVFLFIYIWLDYVRLVVNYLGHRGQKGKKNKNISIGFRSRSDQIFDLFYRVFAMLIWPCVCGHCKRPKLPFHSGLWQLFSQYFRTFCTILSFSYRSTRKCRLTATCYYHHILSRNVLNRTLGFLTQF